MRRRPASEESSLELLLDTICNTFGGILFISLLVVILLNTTSEATRQKPPTEVAHSKMIEANIERDELTQELDQLKAAVSQRRAIVGAVISEDLIRLAKDLKEQRENCDSLLIDKSKAVGQLTMTQSSINQQTKESADIQSKVADARTKLSALKHVFNKKVTAKSRTAPMPKVRHANVDERVFYLRDGKLYGPHLVNGVLNTSDFAEVQQGGETILEITPNGGVQVPTDTNNNDELLAVIKGLDPAITGAKVFVWPDSYAQFDTVRLALGSINLGYELIPVDVGAVIKFGPGTGSGMSLQ